MSQVDQLRNTPFDESSGAMKLPSSLNTLTILTYIGSGLSLLFSLWGFVGAKSNYDKLAQLQESGDIDKMPGFLKGMVGPEVLEMSRKMYENRVPLLIIGLAGALLCIYGASQMRALKKQGFFIWLIGEVLPLLTTLIFIGTMPVNFSSVIIWLIILLFIYLYYTQLKYMR